MKVGTRTAEVGSGENEASGLILANRSLVFDRRLDCLAEFDERSRMFLSRDQVPAGAPLRDVLYECPQWLDQGQEGACVGFGFSHEMLADPVRVKNITDATARNLYKYIQTKDPWPGENYEGTRVLSGAKVLKELGYIPSYYWATSAREVAEALVNLGPLVIGVDWLEDMGDTDREGFIHVSGRKRGGHCTFIRGLKLGKFFDGSTFAVRIRNSWGRLWGVDGDAWITEKDLQLLVDNAGSFCVPTSRADSGNFPPAYRTKSEPWWKRIWR